MKKAKNSEVESTHIIHEEAKENKGGIKTMKNIIKETRAAEAAAKAAAAKEKAKKERLEAIEPIDLVATMGEVADDTAHCVRNEDGLSVGTNGGKYRQIPVVTENGGLTTIAAGSDEELETLKANIANGLSGDGKFHKLVIIGGIPCDCVGATQEELEADIAAAEDYAKKHSRGSIIKDIDIAEQLVDAEFKREDLEQVIGDDGERYIICYDGNYVMDVNGSSIADLSDISSELSKADVKTLLLERLNARIDSESEMDEDDDEDWDDEEYDDDDEGDEDEDEDDDWLHIFSSCKCPLR